MSKYCDFQQVHYPRGLVIVLPIFSLPSPYGIGSFGSEAFRFIDYLKDLGAKYWQVLPLGPTSYGNSPYSSNSSYAGNPYFIDLDQLCDEGLLDPTDLEEQKNSCSVVDYAFLFAKRTRILEKAYKNWKREESFQIFVENNPWLKSYCLFMTLKRTFAYKSWMDWPEDYKNCNSKALRKFCEEHQDQIDFEAFVQYKFYQQWERIRTYAKKQGIYIIGDLPIYVAMDSVDIWEHPELFLQDALSGAPPDFYNKKGQLWGTPIYDWGKIEEDQYSYFIRKIDQQRKLYDILRLDHFIGYIHYWKVPKDSQDASLGRWAKGPGLKLFKALEDKLGPLSLLLEDLGALSEEVIEARESLHFPGMNLIQYAFENENSPYLPHNAEKRSSIYGSTHDSPTLMAWWKNLEDEDRRKVVLYFGLNREEGIWKGLLRGLLSSVSDFCVLQMQDLMSLEEEGRINVPGKFEGNWLWKMPNTYEDMDVKETISKMVKRYGR